MTESRTDFSLPYIVYITKTTNAANPIKRNNHAKIHKDNEGISGICHRFFL